MSVQNTSIITKVSFVVLIIETLVFIFKCKS
nr:MAG TPA: hypothetical protein [Caudoviricetes sp.]